MAMAKVYVIQFLEPLHIPIENFMVFLVFLEKLNCSENFTQICVYNDWQKLGRFDVELPVKSTKPSLVPTFRCWLKFIREQDEYYFCK